MAALSGITAVRPTSTTVMTAPVKYGATISAGQSVYLDSADKKFKLADCNASVTTAAIRGIAVTPGVDGGYGYVATGGSVILVGTTMAVGEVYYVGGTAGSIIPHGDLTTNDYVSRIGTAASTTQLDLDLKATGIQRP
jgi:hypothetical protein